MPTPPEIVAEMLRGTRVGPGDVVYDLGSGDGRIVIAAARDFGARGVGIELDAKLVQDSREAALEAGVGDRVTFVWKDIFDVDLSPATVVTIYLFPEVNARLVPKLKRELRPGARVVSHEYPLGDWRADRWIQVASTVRRHTLLFWTIPARPRWRADRHRACDPDHPEGSAACGRDREHRSSLLSEDSHG